MNVICPNCGQKTHASDCQWCRYPLMGEEANHKPGMNVLTWTISIVLGVILVGLALVYLAPGYELLMIRSDSMSPVLNAGDVIVTSPLNGPINGEVKSGAIVSFDTGKGMIAHRVQSIDGQALVTKGDATEEADPWPVTLSDVSGVHLFTVPYVGYALNFVRTKLGWFLVILLPGVLLIFLLIRDIVREALNTQSSVQKKEVMPIGPPGPRKAAN